jgi:ATPase family associated with various cellular activities (AAA)
MTDGRQAPVAASAGDRPAADLVTVLRDRAPRVALALAAGQMALPLARTARARYWDRATYTVKVPGNDDVYDELHEWVLGLLPRHDQRALVAWTSRRGEGVLISGSGRQPAPEAPAVRLRYDGAREQAVRIGGCKVRVAVSTPEGGTEDRPWKPPEIVFTMTSAAARDALLAEISRVVQRTHQRKKMPAFRMLDKWGDWERLDDVPARTLDSVILPAGQLDRLTEDVGRFLASEAEYRRRCIPWHRGHLYEGPPGTGKTSVARAIASHFGMDVWYLPLADVKKDGELLRVANRVGPRSMLLLEDVDVFHAATQRDDDGVDKATLSGLLNALDGIGTPHGLLTVLTTNTPEVIDPAVIRPGRVDLVEHFGLAGSSEVRQLVTRWYDRGAITPGMIPALDGISPAEVIEACKRNDDPAGAVAELTAKASSFPGGSRR